METGELEKVTPPPKQVQGQPGTKDWVCSSVYSIEQRSTAVLPKVHTALFPPQLSKQTVATDPAFIFCLEIKEKVRCCVSAGVPSRLRFNLNSKEIVKPEHELGREVQQVQAGQGVWLS